MISARSIISYLPIDSLDQDKALEYVYQAFDKIGYRGYYLEKISELKIENFSSPLPTDLVKIGAVVMHHNRDENCTTEEGSTESLQNSDQILRIQNQGIVNNYNMYNGLQNIGANYTILRNMNSPFTNGMLCPRCANINSNCDITYSITPDRRIITSVDDVYLCISYLTYPVDSEGDLMIPDNADLLDALSAYASMKYAEEMMWKNPQTYKTLFDMYSQKWAVQSSKVKAQNQMDNIPAENITAFLSRYKNFVANPTFWNGQLPIRV